MTGTVLVLAGIACGVAALWYLATKYFEDGELGEKKFYAVLQGIEDAHRKDVSTAPLVVKDVEGTGLDVLGVPSGDSTYPRVWFILNQMPASGHVLRMPGTSKVSVPCRDIDDVLRRPGVLPKVAAELSKECTR